MGAIIGLIALVLLTVMLVDDPPKNCTWKYYPVGIGQSGHQEMHGRCVPNKQP